MLATRPHLSILHPSPTTVRFTVSTASQRRTLTSQLTHALFLLLRILLGLFTTLILYLTIFTPPNKSLTPLATLITSYPTSHTLALSFINYFLVFRRFHTEESFLVLRTLGIQTTTLSTSYLLPSDTRFIPTSQIRDIFIHEAFRGFEVRYYLAVVVEGEGEAVVVFPKILPKRAIVEEVWRGARECLYEPKT
ncbi:hypothetical protein ACLMJK_007576 [Lecanora helva]